MDRGALLRRDVARERRRFRVERLELDSAAPF
jgi:hypothetical protein